MARRGTDTVADAAFDSPGRDVHDISLSDEVARSYLEYGLSVIHSRALPDARDGLKPVHRRILFGMNDMGLRPDHAYVKSARVVGDVMGRYHPHGDSAIYDAMVRLAQPFSVNAPLVDGKGNFGSPDDSAAAMRYTEARLSAYAMLLTAELGEDTVNFTGNYDGSLQEPLVLPAAFPNLLVNGGSGIAVGMATNMIPHNFTEVIAATRHLLKHPGATLDALMKHIPGPDLPTGGMILGADQVRLAYETGRGVVRIRATAETGPVEGSRGRQQIVFTDLPYQVGAEKVIDAIKTEIAKKRLAGVADVKDLTDRVSGIQLVVEAKVGVNPTALLAELYKYTPLETSFGIQNLALVEDQPRLLGLKDLLQVFIDHRVDVVTRRTQYRLAKAEARLHIVDGLLIALDNIDEVVQIIKASTSTSDAKAALMKRFRFTDIQATHILDMPLRRLTSLEVTSLRDEQETLRGIIADLQLILADDTVKRKVIDDELATVTKAHPTQRRSILVDGDLAEALADSLPEVGLEIADDPCHVLLSTTGILGRTPVASEDLTGGRRRNSRQPHDTLRCITASTARGTVLAITNQGRAFKTDVLTLPVVSNHPGVATTRGGVSGSELHPLQPGEHVIAVLADQRDDAHGVALITRRGTIKVTKPEWPTRSNDFTIIKLDDGDSVITAQWAAPTDDAVLLSSDASLLRFPITKVRPQGLSGGGVAGINLGADAELVAATVTPVTDDILVTTHTGTTVKTTPLTQYPTKGRATGGVRSHRFLKGENHLVAAAITAYPLAANDSTPIDLPPAMGKRDGSGVPAEPVTVIATGWERTPTPPTP